ncbi:MAG TPA: hypothetical protein VMS71_01255, partial [Candidatus Acidoferrum sp.]|nr:hypothetical protein [Candidatus Acidoferrum sp.]
GSAPSGDYSVKVWVSDGSDSASCQVPYQDFPDCCVGQRGNVDGDPDDICDISDLSSLIDYLFHGGSINECTPEANIDGSIDGTVDVSDVTKLVEYLFFGGVIAGC